jgi:hypothetical protein
MHPPFLILQKEKLHNFGDKFLNFMALYFKWAGYGSRAV